MQKQDWEELLKKFEIKSRRPYLPPPVPRPASAGEIAQFEETADFKLPKSYKDFCQVFGPCELLDYQGNYQIATPGPPSWNGNYELKKFHERVKSYNDEYEDYCKENPSQVGRAFFFATDIATSSYFWDPLEITNKLNNEYKIYVIHRNYEVEFLSDSFQGLVMDVWLGSNLLRYLDEDEGPIRWIMNPPEREELERLCAEDRS